ncbi:MAG: metallophosphoesterase [Paludibacter sp.]|nr:metallophosphoesterase [Paludibacter sp.]
MKIYNSFKVLAVLIAFSAMTVFAQQQVKLVILHTNDTHSQVESTEKTLAKNADMGGYARRMGLIKKIRSEEKNVLLLDAGDFLQGTPYFNFFNGHIEVDALNRMNYTAVNLGNHEFDNGIDSLAMLLKNAKFPVVSSNYDVRNTPLKGMIKHYVIEKRGNIKIGIMSLGVNPKGLVIERNYAGMKFKDPLKVAKKLSCFLKKVKKCDLVICLSHLGSDSASVDVNDFNIARKTKYIDVIIGGHSHTLLENTTTKNVNKKPVVIAQMGKSGLYLGRVDVELENKNNK